MEKVWLAGILAERIADGFNLKLGHGNAIELDQLKWMFHSTHFRNNHKIRIQDEIWLFGAIERVMSRGNDKIIQAINNAISKKHFRVWIASSLANTILQTIDDNALQLKLNYFKLLDSRLESEIKQLESVFINKKYLIA